MWISVHILLDMLITENDFPSVCYDIQIKIVQFILLKPYLVFTLSLCMVYQIEEQTEAYQKQLSLQSVPDLG